jgi:hypothetical protein
MIRKTQDLPVPVVYSTYQILTTETVETELILQLHSSLGSLD